jgi:transposase-like protein
MINFEIIEDFPKSEIEFENRFSTERSCYEYLFRKKWPTGFSCCKCNHEAYWISSKNVYICTRCEHQHSLTAGTIMHQTKKPLRLWFKAMWWFTTRKSGVNAINLKDLLGFGSYDTAWHWLQKLRHCTIRKGREKLSGRVEIDEFFIGGQQPGKRGRGANGKTAVIAAVEKEKRKLGRIRLEVIPDCSSDSILSFIDKYIEPGSTVISDGWKGYYPIDKTLYTHVQVIRSKTADKDSVLPGVHLIASLVKRLMRGTFQCRFDPKYLQNYLDEYVFRFNRRKSRSIGKKFMRIVQQVADSTIITYKNIRLSAENYYPRRNSLGLSG